MDGREGGGGRRKGCGESLKRKRRWGLSGKRKNSVVRLLEILKHFKEDVGGMGGKVKYMAVS